MVLQHFSMASHYKNILIYLLIVVFILQLNRKLVNGNNIKVFDGCFKLQFYWSSMSVWADKVYHASDKLDTVLSCDAGSHVEILTLAYSIPRKFDNYCDINDLINDERETCYKNTQPKCYCCTKPEPYKTEVCTKQTSDVSDLIKQCKHKPQNCSININAVNMRYICQNLDYDVCKDDNSYCLSRWATVIYQCIKDTEVINKVPDTTEIYNQINDTIGVTTRVGDANPEPLLKDWMITAIAIVCVLLLVTIVVIVLLCYRKKKQNNSSTKLIHTHNDSNIQEIFHTDLKTELQSKPQKRIKNKGSSCVKISFNNHDHQISSKLLKDDKMDNSSSANDKNTSVVDFVHNDYYDSESKQNHVHYSSPKPPVNVDDVDNCHYDFVDNKYDPSNEKGTYDNPRTPSVQVSNLYGNKKGHEGDGKHFFDGSIYYDIPKSPENEQNDNIYINTPSFKKPKAPTSSSPLKCEENTYYEKKQHR